MKTDNDKYLILRIRSTIVGLDHVLAMFKSAIKEAIHLERTLVIDKYTMGTRHNLGYEIKNLDIERYINITQTQIYRIKANRSIKQINSTFRYVYAENFDLSKYSAEQVLQLEHQPITEEQDNQYKVIIRKTDNYIYTSFYPDILVAFYPSDEVVRLTDVVLQAMGTSLADVKKRSAVYRDIDFSANRDLYQQDMPDNPLYYACLHVRGTDALIYPHFKYAADAGNIKSIVKQMVAKGARIYLMSDIKNRKYFNFLKQDYIVYQYHDFPELKALVSDSNGLQVDNAMLYSVEKNIFQYADIKIVRSNRKPKLIYTNCSFGVPWRYRFLDFCRYLASRGGFIKNPKALVANIKSRLINTQNR